MIKAGLGNSLAAHVGDLGSEWGWTGVGDVLWACWRIYNIGSGVRRSVKEMLDLLVEMAKVQVEVHQDRARSRPSDVKVVAGR